jgi:hypothetical protein
MRPLHYGIDRIPISISTPAIGKDIENPRLGRARTLRRGGAAACHGRLPERGGGLSGGAARAQAAAKKSFTAAIVGAGASSSANGRRSVQHRWQAAM